MKLLPWILIVLVSILSGCAGNIKNTQSAPQQETKAAAPTTYTVTAPRAGKVLGLIVEKGERIGKDQPLFAIEDAEADGAVKNISLQLTKAQAELQRMKNGTPTTNAVDISALQERVTAAQQKASKMNNLLAQGAVSRVQAQLAQAELHEATAALQAAAQAQQSLKPASAESIAEQEKIIATLEAQQKAALAKQEQNEGLSPCTGIITAIHVTNGATVAKDAPIIEIRQAD